jgi:hypothetical protein
LIAHTASTIHRQLSRAQQIAAGAGLEPVPLSIGVETADDRIRDLDQTLGAQNSDGNEHGAIAVQQSPLSALVQLPGALDRPKPDGSERVVAHGMAL